MADIPIAAASKRKTNHNEMRSNNLSLVLNLILSSPAHISRAGVSKSTELTRATASSLVDELIELGYLREIGVDKNSSPGKPAVLLDICPDKIFAIGLSLRESTLYLAKVNLLGEISCLEQERIAGLAPADTYKLMRRMLHTRINIMHATGEKLAGIGLSLPCPVIDRKIRYSFTLKEYEGFNFYELLRAEFPYPIFVENDADASVLAESWYGAARGFQRVFYLLVNHGIGSSFSYNQDLYFGVHNITPEFGHFVALPDGPRCFCGRRGCLEAIASDLALQNYKLNDGVLTDMLYTDPQKFRSGLDQTISGFAQSPEQQIPDYVWTCAKRLGIAVANLITTLCSDLIILNGPVFSIPTFFGRVVETARQNVHPMLAEYMNIKLSGFGNHTALIGAGTLALRSLYLNPMLVSAFNP